MSLGRLTAGAILLASLLMARPAAAAGAEAILGADFLVDDNAGGIFGALALDTALSRNLTFGGRFGAYLESGPSRLGIPLDARLRFHTRQAYVDGLIGPWIMFGQSQHVRFHAALGGGFVLQRRISLGMEVGYLDPSSLIGARVGFGF